MRVTDLRLQKGVCNNTNAARKPFLVPTDQGPYSPNATSERPFLDWQSVVKSLPSSARVLFQWLGTLDPTCLVAQKAKHKTEALL